MGKAQDAGPRRLDQTAKQGYQDVSNAQATAAKEKSQQIQAEKTAQNDTGRGGEKGGDNGGGFGGWRKGNFSEPKEETK